MTRLSAERPARIAVVVPKYGLVGGGELFAFELTERLATDPRFEIHVVANRWRAASKRIFFHKVPIFSFPKWLTTPSFACFVRQKLNRLRPDIVHTHDRIFRADIATVHSIPHRIWVEEIRGKRVPSLFDLATIWVEERQFAWGNCRKFLTVSTLAADQLRRCYPQVADRIEVVPPGIDPTRYGPAEEEDRTAIRQEFGVGEDDILLLFAGMNFELKGLPVLMEALAAIRKQQHPKRFRLLVAGKGDLPKFRALAQRCGVDGDVFFAGVRHDMPRLYRGADIFCLLSRFDTFGMVVGEALASGVPVVVSDRVGAKDLVTGGNGRVVSADDPIGIGETLMTIADFRTLAGMRASAARSVAGLSWTTTARRVTEIYEEILLCRGRSSPAEKMESC